MMLLDSGIESGSSPELRHHRIPHHQHHHHHKDHDPHSMSRTHQYRKVMKPLLERKRRARINKCLDELKDIMTVALQAQGENVSKLEKADILELTVRHLHKLSASQRLLLNSPPTQRNPLEEVQRFQAGYSSCAQEAASFLLSSPGVDVSVSQRLLSHLSSNLSNPVMAAAAQTAHSALNAILPPQGQVEREGGWFSQQKF